MALPNLATTTDLFTRGVEVSDLELVETMLATASAVVRNAAQSPILETTSTVTVWVTETSRWLDLPGKPITAVSEVWVDGEPLDPAGYRFANGRLWCRNGNWNDAALGDGSEPVEVQVTLTHGYATVPSEITHLVVDLTIAGINAATEGTRSPGVLVESIDDYSVTFTQGADAVASVMELPAATKRALRHRFGGGVSMVTSL